MEVFISLQTRRIEINLAGEMTPLLVAELDSLEYDPEDPDQVPCWAEVWPAAIGLARYFWHQEERLNNRSVLELGAGVGLPGLVCGLKGARVTFSDFQPLALRLCDLNARLHNLRGYRLLQEDWRVFNCRERFDLVLGADITYEPYLLPFLQEIITAAVRPGGAVILSHPGRPQSRECVRRLLETAFFREELTLIPVTVEDPVLSYHVILVHDLRRVG